MTNVPTQVAIVFADVSGSTSLYEKLGDRSALAAIETVVNEMRKSITREGGRIVKTIGDEVMAALPSADAALLAACDMQNRVAAIAAPDNLNLAIRVGFHFGTAIEVAGDFYGDVVNTAARMVGLAKGGQIITSSTTMTALSPLLRESTRDLDVATVKGKQDEIRIYEVIWREGDDLTTLAAPHAASSASDIRLTVEYGAYCVEVGAARPQITLGREAGNDLIIADQMASRTHCKIEHRRGKFFLIDQSTNGTYVTMDRDAEIVLKREQLMLRGSGVISLGHSMASAGAEAVAFRHR